MKESCYQALYPLLYQGKEVSDVEILVGTVIGLIGGPFVDLDRYSCEVMG